MKAGIALSAIMLLAPVLSSACRTDQPPVPITLHRVSERVAVLKVGDVEPFGHLIRNNVVAIAARDGLALVDTGYFPRSATELRRITEQEFGGRKVTHVINTHSHWDHVNGNLAFPDAEIVAHPNVRQAMRRFESGMDHFLRQRRERVAAWRERLELAEPGSEEALVASGWIYAHQKFLDESEGGYQILYPTLEVPGRMSLDLGGLVLELIHVPYFHTDGDLLVHVPEERLLVTGDLFQEGTLPRIRHSAVADLPEWLENLEGILTTGQAVDTIVPGHGELLTNAGFRAQIGYMKALREAVIAARGEGRTFEETRERHGQPEAFGWPGGASHQSERNTHLANIARLWENGKGSAILELQRLLDEGGTGPALEAFERSCAGDGLLYIDGEEFIDTAYYHYMFGRNEEAAVVLGIALDADPDSWEAWDLLGDVHLSAGNRSGAMESYENSLALNPDNENAMSRLKELGRPPGT